ncbi:MAG TPA: M3 family metallopeptidase, partial [Polyangiaceae bacterium]|nr:M3 family metallopeptidase [Polyangiaceae bacterium]
MDNPLLASAAAAPLPSFDRIRPEHAEPALDAVLAENRAQLDALVGAAGRPDWDPTWEALIEPLEEMGDRVSRVWGPLAHLFGVTSTAGWRQAYNACLPKMTVYSLELSQNEHLLRAYERLAASPAYAGFSAARKKVVADAMRDFRLSGIGLPAAEKARFTAIELRLSELHSKFEENLIDSVQAYANHVTDESRLRGMTAQGKELAREKARAKGLEGFLIAPLDFPSYDAVVSYADDRELRRELYEAYSTRASDRGPLAGKFDNTALMDEIMALRHEEARLLGYANFAEVSLATKMADTPDEIDRFLVDLNR